MKLTHSNRPARRHRGDAIMGFLVLLALLCIFGLLSRCKPVQNLFSSNYSDFNAIAPGWTETQVRKHLGKPTHEHLPPEPGAPQWNVSGYAAPKRGITGKVLVYLSGDLVCYCFLDKKGIIEETFIGGS